MADVEGLHSRSQVHLPGQADQHDVMVVVLGCEVLVELRVREEVRDSKQLLWTLPFPEVMLPEADPQIPAGTCLRGQDECPPGGCVTLYKLPIFSGTPSYVMQECCVILRNTHTVSGPLIPTPSLCLPLLW